jgi:magnesium-transporting ATPase (P-type)
MSGLLNSAWTWLGYCLVFQSYHVPLSSLPFSSDYWVADADPFVYGGPDGCSVDSTDPAYSPDCLAYTASEQLDILSQAQGVVFYQLVMFQLFHILMCKTRFQSIFRHPMTENVVMMYGMLIETALMIIFLFVPVLNALLVGIPMPGKFFALPLLSWGSLFILSEGRKWIVRKYPNGLAHRYLSW